MGDGGIFAELIVTCREVGSEIEAREFSEACLLVASALSPEMDEGLAQHLNHLLASREHLSEHLDLLVTSGERLAAAWIVVPDHWGRRVSREFNGCVRAAVELPTRGWQAEVTSDEEGAALLGALAAAVGAASNVVPFR